MVTMAERLKKLRKDKGMTQNEIAKKLNISRPAYSYYETGKKQPTIETLKKLAEIYQTSIDYLVGRY